MNTIKCKHYLEVTLWVTYQQHPADADVITIADVVAAVQDYLIVEAIIPVSGLSFFWSSAAAAVTEAASLAEADVDVTTAITAAALSSCLSFSASSAMEIATAVTMAADANQMTI